MYTERSSEIVNVKLPFWSEASRLLGRTITPEAVSPQADKIKNFLAKLKFQNLKTVPKGILVF